jgi:hypothetical protein
MDDSARVLGTEIIGVPMADRILDPTHFRHRSERLPVMGKRPNYLPKLEWDD